MDNPTKKYIPKSVRLMDQVREVLGFITMPIILKSPMSPGYYSISDLMTGATLRIWAKLKLNLF
jgi:hypothetical protein